METNKEVIETARENLKWPDRKLAFDVESCICNYQKKLEGDEPVEDARDKVLKEKSGTSC